MEEECEIGFTKERPVCKLKILECIADTDRHWFGPMFDKFRQIPKNSLT